MFQDINGMCYGKLKPTDKIAPHLNVGFDEPLDTKPKPNVKLQRLQALFEGNDYVGMADARLYTNQISRIRDVAKNRGFREVFSGSGILTGFSKAIERTKTYQAHVKIFSDEKINIEDLVDLMLVEVSRNKTISPENYSKYQTSLINRAIKKVREILAENNQYLDTIRKKRQGKSGSGRVDYYRLVTVIEK